jgi:hypothetical protein
MCGFVFLNDLSDQPPSGAALTKTYRRDETEWLPKPIELKLRALFKGGLAGKISCFQHKWDGGTFGGILEFMELKTLYFHVIICLVR